MLVSLLTLLILVAAYGFGRNDQPSGQPCSKWHELLDTMEITGSLQRANGVGARATAPVRIRTV